MEKERNKERKGNEKLLKQIKNIAEKRLEEWKTTPLKIGVMGQSGTGIYYLEFNLEFPQENIFLGKSSFINAIRDLPDNRIGKPERNPDSAWVGTTQTTKEPKEFRHQENKNYVLVDLPGVNTVDFKREDYLKKVEFDSYDCYVIISKGRFSDDDQWLAEQAKRMNKSFFFVRSQV